MNHLLVSICNSLRNRHTSCHGCMLGKQHKSSYFVNPDKQRCAIPGQFLHGDVSGKMSTSPIKGAKYYILLKDDATSCRFVHFAKH